VKWGDVMLGQIVDIRPLLDEETRNVVVAIMRCDVERSKSGFRCYIRIVVALYI